MFNLEKYPWIVPVLMIFVGAGWLMNTLKVLPGVNWAYTFGVGAVGLVILLQGLNKYSFVIGLFLVFGSIASYLRQTNVLELEIQVPVMVMVLGLLMLVAHYAKLPNPPDSSETGKQEQAKKQRLGEGGTPKV